MGLKIEAEVNKSSYIDFVKAQQFGAHSLWPVFHFKKRFWLKKSGAGTSVLTAQGVSSVFTTSHLYQVSSSIAEKIEAPSSDILT